jgi:hypothetical protein
LRAGASQTRSMAQTYLLFDFGTDEEKAQQARHKLEGWKQAFRLDKKLLYKMDRGEGDAADKATPAAKEEKTPEAGKSKGKGKVKASESKEEKAGETDNGKVSLLVRLYFSGHEKLSEHRWVERIPSEEPFKDASPRVIRQDDAQFDEVLKQFENLD